MSFNGSYNFILASTLKGLKGLLKHGMKRCSTELNPIRMVHNAGYVLG